VLLAFYDSSVRHFLAERAEGSFLVVSDFSPVRSTLSFTDHHSSTKTHDVLFKAGVCVSDINFPELFAARLIA
jgi:hypothetical protein